MAMESVTFAEQRHYGVTVPRASVVVGAYNTERFLGPAIESILN
jgi:hypothetical protein